MKTVIRNGEEFESVVVLDGEITKVTTIAENDEEQNMHIWDHFLNGIRYGYPICCIIQFCYEVMQNIVPWATRAKQFGIDDIWPVEIDYVPCNHCMRKIGYTIK